MKQAPDTLSQIYRNLYDLLDRRERYLAILIFGLMLLVALADAIGVASILPFMAVLANPQMIHTNRYLDLAYNFFSFNSQQSFLLFLGLSLFFILIGSLALKAFSFWAQVKFSNTRVHSLSYLLFTTYLNQSYSWFIENHTSGLSNKILSEVSEVVYGALFPALQVVANSLAVVFLLLLLIAVDPVLAISASVALTCVYGTILALGRRALDRIGGTRTSSNNERYRIVQEALGGIKDVKISGLEWRFLERFQHPSTVMARGNTSAKIISELPSFAMQGLIFGGLLAVLLYLVRAQGGLSQALPVLAIFAFAGYRLMPALQSVYNQLTTLRYHAPLLRTLHSDFQDLPKLPPARPADKSSERLTFTNRIDLVETRYTYQSAHRAALDGVNINIPIHSKIGLVGSSGSGKTTAVDIILGLLESQHGELRVDGKAINRSNLRIWQRNLGYVPQQIYLTDETIAGNIAFGVPADLIDLSAVERAARIANLHDFVMSDLKDGYKTVVGERGVKLSGGQRQRIGIARALYHDPQILILDEATSALDNLTEKVVMEAMDNLGNEKTIVLVAHRLSTVKSCDCIYLLDHGHVVASGTFAELAASNEQFRAMAGDV